MCCITIGTDVMLANFFGSPGYLTSGLDGADLDVIKKCAVTLANNLPGYVFFDLTQKKVDALVNGNHGYIYQGGKIMYIGKGIDLKRYNDSYTPGISEKIEKIVNGFFKQQLYAKEIKPLVQVYA